MGAADEAGAGTAAAATVVGNEAAPLVATGAGAVAPSTTKPTTRNVGAPISAPSAVRRFVAYPLRSRR